MTQEQKVIHSLIKVINSQFLIFSREFKSNFSIQISSLCTGTSITRLQFHLVAFNDACIIRVRSFDKFSDLLADSFVKYALGAESLLYMRYLKNSLL